MDPTWPAYPIFSCLAFIVVFIPLPWHLEAWNTGTCLYMIWAGLSALNAFVNSIVWHNNALNVAPIWCDISARLQIGASVAIPAASLCINRRLYMIAAVQAVTVTKREKRRAILVDLSICLGFPLVIMILQYIVQGHRSNIYEDFGCSPDTFDTLPAYFIVWMWPLVIGLFSMVYCAMTLRAFATRRAQFTEFLSSNTSISFSRYFRLMALASTEMCLTVPLGAVSIWLNATAVPVSPWEGEANAHWGFHRVDQFPAVLWHSNKLIYLSLELQRWLVVFCCFVFFAYFGFADEAMRNYKKAYWAVAGRFGFKPSQMRTTITASSSWGPKMGTLSNSKGATLPVFVSQRTHVKRDSFLSSVGDLSSSFTVEAFEDGKGSPTRSFSSGSFPPSPDDELSGLPHLPAVAPLPPAHHRMSADVPALDFTAFRRLSVDVPTPVRPPRPDSLDIV